MEEIVNNVTKITFDKSQSSEFYTTVKQRVNDYFVNNNLSRHANGAMVAKTVFILSGFVLTYVILLSNIFSPWWLFAIAGIHGFFTALIGLNIAHDAIHGAYSSNKTLNKVLGLLFNLVGANDYVWKITHNIVHHTYTNIPDHDDDIDQIPILRLNPNQDLWWIHRYQHIYGVFLYTLSSFSWVFMKDYKKFFAYNIGGHINRHPRKEYYRLFLYKALYYILFVIIPFTVIELPWYQILAGFLFLHAVEGATLSFVFQLAHVVDGPEFPEPDENGFIDRSWAAHQMHTTADFARGNNLANFLFGGLNFQIEHHLFPKVCHIHYKKIAPIVQDTAMEFGLPYYDNPSYLGAVRSHLHELRIMGSPQPATA